MILPRRKLVLEALECRALLSTATDPIVQEPPPSNEPAMIADNGGSQAGVAPADSTEDPVDSGNTFVQVRVTGLGPRESGRIHSITVSGLTPENVQSFSSIRFTLGGNTYVVDTASPGANGHYTLTIVGGLPAQDIAVGLYLTLQIGTPQGNETPPAEEPPPESPAIPPSDPTEAPVE